MCGVLVTEKDEKKLAQLGVKDSKLLTPKKRTELAKKIKNVVKDYAISIISPKDIDAALLSDDLNLNWMEAKESAGIIDELKPHKAIIDSPSNNLVSYSRGLKEFLKNKKVEIDVEHKADLKYVVVSAASILAKVTRDNEIKKLKKKIGIDFGSGYPADPKTKDFLLKNYKRYPDIFRKTWSPYKKIVKSKGQMKISNF